MSWVYFIGNSGTAESWVKIGFTTGNVHARRDSLQTGCPFLLDVLVYAPGTMNDERRLHERFASYRGPGEWFVLEGSLQAYVANLIDTATGMEPAPTLWTDLYREAHKS